MAPVNQPEHAMSDKPDNPNARKQRLKQVAQEATILAEAYRLRLVGRLWWANLSLVVLPAVCATAAAIFAAGPGGLDKEWSRIVAAWLAGLAAVLTAIHKSLKCEEYQVECLRLGSGFEAIAARAESARVATENADDPKSDELKDLTERFATLKESAKSVLPNVYIRKAEKRTTYYLYPTNGGNADIVHAPERSA